MSVMNANDICRCCGENGRHVCDLTWFQFISIACSIYNNTTAESVKAIQQLTTSIVSNANASLCECVRCTRQACEEAAVYKACACKKSCWP